MQIVLSLIMGISLIVSAVVFSPNEYGGQDDLLGATSFPTSLDALTNPAATDSTQTVSHSSQHSNANDAIEALQAKVGADGSAVTTSHTYKLSGVTGSDVACSLTATQVLTNKTLTSPTINSPVINSATIATSTLASTTMTGSTTHNGQFRLTLGSDTTGDIFYRQANGYLARLGIGNSGEFLKVTGGVPVWAASQANAPTVTVNATSSASTTKLLVADGTTQINITAYGQAQGDASGASENVTLTIGSNVMDTFTYDNPGAGSMHTFYLRYSGVPSAGTTTIELTNSADSNVFGDASIWVDAY